MSDYLQPQDLIDDKKHSTFFSEVITGKTGGVAGGANIDTATNAVTSQTQKTMPKIMGDAELSFDAQLDAQQVEHASQISAHEIEHDNQIAAHESEFISQLQAQGWNPVAGSFETGGAIVNRRDILWWEAAKSWYSWQGTIPLGGYIVAAGSTPATAGGASPTAWVDRTDGALRSELADDGGASKKMLGGIRAHAIAGDVADFLLKVKQVSDAGGGTVVWPPATIVTDTPIKIGNNIGDAGGYFGAASISNVTIHADGVNIVPATAGSSVNLDELVMLIDATDCAVYGFSVNATVNTNPSSRGGIRMAGCERCDWYYPVVNKAQNYSLIVSGAQFGVGTRNGAHNNVYRAKVTDQRVWTGNSAAQIIAANGASFTTFHSCYSSNLIDTAGIDLFDDDNAPYTKFVYCVALGTAATGAGFWLEGVEQTAPSYRVRCMAIGMSLGFGSSEYRWSEDEGCVSYGITGRALWSRNRLDTFSNCRYIDGGTIDIEKGAELSSCSQVLVYAASLPNVTITDAGGNTDGVVRLIGGSYGDIVVNETGCLSIELIGADVKSIQTYNSQHRNITQNGGRCRSPSLINRGTWYANDVDFEIIQGGLFPVTASIDSASVELMRCKFKALDGEIYSGAGFSHLKIRDSVLTNCPNAVNTNEVKLVGTTAAYCRELYQLQGLVNINARERNNSDGFPSLSMVLAANSPTDTRTSNVLITKAGTLGESLTCTWNINSYPTISKSGSAHDGVYTVVN